MVHGFYLYALYLFSLCAKLIEYVHSEAIDLVFQTWGYQIVQMGNKNSHRQYTFSCSIAHAS